MVSTLQHYLFLNPFSVIRLGLISSILGLASSVAIAQTNTPARDSLQLVPRVFTIGEVADYSSQSRQLILNVEALKDQRSELVPVEQEFLELDTLFQFKIDAISDSNTLWRLDQLEKEEQEVQLIKSRLEAKKTQIQGWTADAQNSDLELNFLQASWSLTLDSLEQEMKVVEGGSPEELEIRQRMSENITTLQSDLRTTQTALRSHRNYLQSVQSELNVTLDKINQVQILIKTRIDDVVNQIWLPDRPPIWKLFQDTLVEPTQIEEFTKIFAIESNIWAGYRRTHPNLPLFLLGFSTTLLLLIFYLRSKKEKLDVHYQEELAPASTLLSYPIFSTLVITWFMVELFFSLPSELGQAFAAYMIIPVCFLYWRIDPERKWWEVGIIALFYMAFLLLTPVRQFPILHRVLLLLVSLGALARLFTYRRNNRAIRNYNATWFNLLPLIVNFFIGIGTLALIGTIMGSIQLAQLLCRAMLGSYLSFIILNEAVILFRSLLFMLALGPLHDKSNILRDDSETVLHWTKRILSFVALLLWLYLTADLLSIRKVIVSTADNILNSPLTIGNVSISLGAIISFFLILQVTNWTSKFVRYILDKEVFPRVKLNEGVPNTISLMVRFTFSIIGFVFAIGALGIDLEKVAIAVGALGVGIGFGLQQVVNNFLSGIILALERPIKIGDIIDLPEVSGRVTDIGLRASTVRSWDGSDVVVPNGSLLANPLVNWTKSDKRRRVKVDVRVPFESDPEEVGKILIRAASAHPNVLSRPGPYLNFEGIGTSAMEIKLYFWIGNADDIFTLGTEVRTMVYRALREAGYQTPVPKQDIQVTSDQLATQTSKDQKPQQPDNGSSSMKSSPSKETSTTKARKEKTKSVDPKT